MRKIWLALVFLLSFGVVSPARADIIIDPDGGYPDYGPWLPTNPVLSFPTGVTLAELQKASPQSDYYATGGVIYYFSPNTPAVGVLETVPKDEEADNYFFYLSASGGKKSEKPPPVQQTTPEPGMLGFLGIGGFFVVVSEKLRRKS